MPLEQSEGNNRVLVDLKEAPPNAPVSFTGYGYWYYSAADHVYIFEDVRRYYENSKWYWYTHPCRVVIPLHNIASINEWRADESSQDEAQNG